MLATAELGCQHITILAHHLKELRETPLDEAALGKFPFLRDPPAKKQAPYYKNLKTPQRFLGQSASIVQGESATLTRGDSGIVAVAMSVRAGPTTWTQQGIRQELSPTMDMQPIHVPAEIMAAK